MNLPLRRQSSSGPGINKHTLTHVRLRFRMRATIAHVDRRWHDLGQLLVARRSSGVEDVTLEQEETKLLEMEVHQLLQRDLRSFEYLWDESFQRKRCGPDDNGAIEAIEVGSIYPRITNHKADHEEQQYKRMWMCLESEARGLPGQCYTEAQFARRLTYMLHGHRIRQMSSTSILYRVLRAAFKGRLQPLNRDTVSWLLVDPASPLTLYRKMRLVAEVERFYERVLTISDNPMMPMVERYHKANFSAFFGAAFTLPPDYGFDVIPLVSMWARTVEGMVETVDVGSLRLSMSATMWLHERRFGSDSKIPGRLLPPPEMNY
ncbi:hypothetical protein PENSPDRAFT_682078 [Peniophora sp. CONT]|nr:hypothetical protein PENSPDRAFT_682078 [Peniophora sp. CONT]